MRNRYGRALCGLAATVAVSATFGLTAAGAATASTTTVKPAVTPACTYGQYCSDPLFNVEFGIQYFESNNSGEENPGSLISLAYANEHRPWQVYKTVFENMVELCQVEAKAKKKKFWS